jgi:hypothetical protein
MWVNIKWQDEHSDSNESSDDRVDSSREERRLASPVSSESREDRSDDSK